VNETTENEPKPTITTDNHRIRIQLDRNNTRYSLVLERQKAGVPAFLLMQTGENHQPMIIRNITTPEHFDKLYNFLLNEIKPATTLNSNKQMLFKYYEDKSKQQPIITSCLSVPVTYKDKMISLVRLMGGVAIFFVTDHKLIYQQSEQGLSREKWYDTITVPIDTADKFDKLWLFIIDNL